MSNDGSVRCYNELMRIFTLTIAVFICGILSGIGGVIFWQKTQVPNAIFTPDPTPTPEPVRPLLRYSFDQLRKTPLNLAPISLDGEALTTSDEYQTYSYMATPLGRRMSGVVNLPHSVTASTSAIIMLRGWVPPNQYSPGVGTKNVAAALAKAGFVTIAPDFYGYGTSEAEPKDEWQARFEKPMTVLEIYRGLQQNGFTLPDGTQFLPEKIGIWGHSNGGQIALSALTILQEEVPVSLWAPVSAPFPYSLLYFTDEEADEGKVSRKWISLFEELYDARLFSFTNYLDGLRGPLLLQQGTNDDAVLKWWSDEFIAKITKENERRKNILELQADAVTVASDSALDISDGMLATPAAALAPIRFTYQLYQGADHNLRPDWDSAVARDIAFFMKELNLSP